MTGSTPERAYALAGAARAPDLAALKALPASRNVPGHLQAICTAASSRKGQP